MTPYGDRVLPPLQVLSSDQLTPQGIYLLDAGFVFYVLVGFAAPSEMVQALLGISSAAGVDSRALRFSPKDSPFARRVVEVINVLRASRGAWAPILLVPFDSAPALGAARPFFVCAHLLRPESGM